MTSAVSSGQHREVNEAEYDGFYGSVYELKPASVVDIRIKNRMNSLLKQNCPGEEGAVLLNLTLRSKCLSI